MDTKITVRLTSDQLKVAQAAAAVRGLSVPAFMKAATLNVAMKTNPALAASSELLAAAHALSELAAAPLGRPDLAAQARQHAGLAIAIIASCRPGDAS